jgi:putative addiction module killer protein
MRTLKDNRAKRQIDAHLRRLCEGNRGDCKSVGDGIFELRIQYGPGFRVYCKDTGKELVILLCGGNKSTQSADIARAKEIAAVEMEEEHGKNNHQ